MSDPANTYNFNLPWQERQALSKPSQFNLSDYGSNYKPTLNMNSPSYDPNRALAQSSGQFNFSDYGTTTDIFNPEYDMSRVLMQGDPAKAPSLGTDPAIPPGPAPMNMQDWGTMAFDGINAASGLMQAFNGWEQSKMAKKQFKQGQENFKSNFNNQVQSNNTYMRDRQAIRHADSGGKQQSVEEYMAKNKVKGI